MQKEFLKEVIVLIAGKQAEDLVNILNNDKYVNEFLIAKKLDITINQTRNILYKISEQGLVSSVRKKDKKKGWYTYSWKLEILKMLEFFRKIILKQIDQINNQIKSRESKMFYVCERCNIEMNEENALLNDFTCSECGQIFTVKDNSKILKELSKNLDKLKKELQNVDDEIETEKLKFEKKRFRELKKQVKKKVSARKTSKSKIPKKKTAKKKTVNKKSPKKKVSKKKSVKKKTTKKPVKKSLKKKITKKKISKKKTKSKRGK